MPGNQNGLENTRMEMRAGLQKQFLLKRFEYDGGIPLTEEIKKGIIETIRKGLENRGIE